MGSGTANAAGTASEALVAAASQGGKDDSPAGKCPNAMESHFHNIETAYTDIVVCPPTIEPAKDGEFLLDAVCHIYYMLSPHSPLDTICWMFLISIGNIEVPVEVAAPEESSFDFDPMEEFRASVAVGPVVAENKGGESKLHDGEWPIFVKLRYF